jgi:hypothetical protein
VRALIPNVFISSTIADLDHFRSAIREVIEEIGYRAVMSEFGEVGYLNPNTAADSCYKSLQQCQMLIVVLGKRYGSTDESGFSVTHKEYRTARESRIPTLTLVDQEVAAFRKVYQADPNAALWSNFSPMDNPRGTFGLLDEIGDSPMYNAIIPFATVTEARRKLKLQIADFVGNKLNETIAPVTGQIHEMLAELKTLRKQLTESSGTDTTASRKYLTVTRFLLSDRVADYRKLLEELFGDLDAAIDNAAKCECFPCIVEAAGYSYRIASSKDVGAFVLRQRGSPPEEYPLRSFRCNEGGYEIYRNRELVLSQELFEKYDQFQKALSAKLVLSHN